MNPHETDVVERALTHLHRATTAGVVAPELDVIVDRARRRRRNQVALAGMTALVAVMVGIVVAGPRPTEQSQLPISPTSPTLPPEPQGQTRVDAATTIPSGFLENRPHLGTVNPDLLGAVDDATESRDNGVLGNPQCLGAPVDRLTVSRGAGMGGPPVRVSLYLYAEEATARTVFAGVEARGLPTCLGYPDAQPTAEQWRSFGAQSLAVTFPQLADGAGELTGMPHRAVVVRVGRAIEVFESGPSNGRTGPVEAASREALESITELSLPRLCLYTDAGCAPAAGSPEPLAELTRDGAAWLLLLDYVNNDGPPLRGGQAVAFAAEAGYHPTIVRLNCDVSPDIPWAEGGSRGAYVALYFAQRSEAEAAAAALPAAAAAYLVPTIHQVTTRCVG